MIRYEADVVVIGTGPAGMAAVTAAARRGADVIAIEALDHIGGNCVWSTGYLAFVGTDIQREHGIRDDEHLFMADAAHQFDLVKERHGIIWDTGLTRIFARESAETYRFLTSNGVRFTRFIPRRPLHSVDRMMAVEDTWMFKRAFVQFFAMPNVRTLFATSADRLIVENGRVGGVVANKASDDGNRNEAIEIRARDGVVLATGGYHANPEMRKRFQPEYMADTPYLGIDTARGDGHLLGCSVGGDLINMTCIPALVIVASSFVEDAIAINRAGLRFHDEAASYDDRVNGLFAQSEGWGSYIIDSATAHQKSSLLAQMPEAAISAPTLTELAVAIGCKPSSLVETVTRWNTFLAGSDMRDTEFGRVVLPAGRRGIVEPPFFASRMVVGASFTWGGFSVTEAMQVINVFGESIAGLYAAGDTVGGLNVIADMGGIHICSGMTLGRIAGESAATGRSIPPVRPLGLKGASRPSLLGTRVALIDERRDH